MSGEYSIETTTHGRYLVDGAGTGKPIPRTRETQPASASLYPHHPPDIGHALSFRLNIHPTSSPRYPTVPPQWEFYSCRRTEMGSTRVVNAFHMPPNAFQSSLIKEWNVYHGATRLWKRHCKGIATLLNDV